MRTEPHVIFALAYKLRVVFVTNDTSVHFVKMSAVNIYLSHT
jgi:hypothetical protein